MIDEDLEVDGARLRTAMRDAGARAQRGGHAVGSWVLADDRLDAVAVCMLCGCELRVDLQADGDPVAGNATRSECFVRGVDRVVVDQHGHAESPMRAAELHGIRADLVFVRSDGWKLGAPQRFEDVARSLWPEMWVEVRRA